MASVYKMNATVQICAFFSLKFLEIGISSVLLAAKLLLKSDL